MITEVEYAFLRVFVKGIFSSTQGFSFMIISGVLFDLQKEIKLIAGLSYCVIYLFGIIISAKAIYNISSTFSTLPVDSDAIITFNIILVVAYFIFVLITKIIEDTITSN